MKEYYSRLSTLDSLKRDYKNAYFNHLQYIFWRDSITNTEREKKITQISMQHEFSKREDSLRYHHALALKHQELLTARQRTSKNYLIAGIILVAGLSFFAYSSFRTRQQLKLQTLRNKIAADLHDDVGSTLSSISLFSQVAQEESKQVIPALETIGESSRKMLDAMADIVWTINPENDQFEKIILRMRNFAFELLGAKQIEFRFVTDKDVSGVKLSMEARKNLYLIFKEATNNMVKYSEARKATFSIKGEGDKLVMQIRDDGKGFDTAAENMGNGLRNMRKRAVDIGALLLIDSMPGRGTTIRLELLI